MPMEEIALIRFIDADIRAVTLVSVRAGQGLTELRLMLPGGGEIEVVMTPEDCRRLLAALYEAIVRAEASSQQ